MEAVSLNSEPVFDEGDEYEDIGDCIIPEHEKEFSELQLTKEPLLPTVHLEFESFNEAYDYYNIYAKEQGFGIRVSNSWFRSKGKERYRAKLSCSNAGFKKKSSANNPRPETRTGCPAMIVIKLVDSKTWKIVEIELQHNHTVSPEIKRFYKSHKKMVVSAKKAHSIQPVTEVHTIKLYRTSVTDGIFDGYANPIVRSNHLELKDGDALAVYNYFTRMKLTNPNFFYLMDLDEEGRLRNLFWADSRSRTAYTYFHDSISIDTSCLTNKFDLPLITFVGVNHHGESVLLGCGFLGYESIECFVWMFKTWLTCMLNQSPQVIITDQSKPVCLAVSEVFPQARHCYNLSYIMQRIPEKLGGLKGYEMINTQLKKAVYNLLKIAEFEILWAEMMTQHSFTENKWLQGLYEERRRWVPVYLKDTLCMGMIPVKENEGLNMFFNGYVHKHTSFKEFVDKYELALQRKHLREAIADMDSRNELKTKSNFELQLSKVYTKEIFEKFQAEVEGMYSCFNTRQINVTGSIVTFIVKERVEIEGKEKEIRHYEVLYETNRMEIRCICSLFNFKGYLCRHALNVLNYCDVEEVPSQYILARWNKDYKCRSGINSNLDVNSPVERYNHLCKYVTQVAQQGAQSQEHYKILLQELEKL